MALAWCDVIHIYAGLLSRKQSVCVDQHLPTSLTMLEGASLILYITVRRRVVTVGLCQTQTPNNK